MRIAYLLGSLNSGGTENLLLDIFKNAEKNKIDAIGIYRKTGELEAEYQNSGLPVSKLSPPKNKFIYILRLRSLLLKNKIDIAHAQQPLDAFYAWIASFGKGIKILLTLHEYDYSMSNIDIILLNFIIRRTDENIFVSHTQRKYYQQKYKLKFQKQNMVYNGISFDKLDNCVCIKSDQNDSFRAKYLLTLPISSNLRELLKLQKNTILIGSVGNFVPGRDQLTLCRFLKLLQEKKYNFHFVFVGKRTNSNPQLYDDCKEYCKQNGLFENVTFLGSRNDVPLILHQLDAFLFSSDHDTFGIAVVEAMAVGIPVFVNDWEVMSEITSNGKYAILYKTKDENDLLREFMLFLQNRPVYQTKAKEAARYVRERYSIERHIVALQEVYNKVTND